MGWAAIGPVLDGLECNVMQEWIVSGHIPE